MSRRGVFPLFIATTFGIINGVWVFGPALKEQREAKDALSESKTEVTLSRQEEAMKVLAAGTSASRSAATATVLKPEAASAPWWSLWTNNQEMRESSSKDRQTVSQGESKDEKR